MQGLRQPVWAACTPLRPRSSPRSWRRFQRCTYSPPAPREVQRGHAGEHVPLLGRYHGPGGGVLKALEVVRVHGCFAFRVGYRPDYGFPEGGVFPDRPGEDYLRSRFASRPRPAERHLREPVDQGAVPPEEHRDHQNLAPPGANAGFEPFRQRDQPPLRDGGTDHKVAAGRPHCFGQGLHPLARRPLVPAPPEQEHRIHHSGFGFLRPLRRSALPPVPDSPNAA